MDGGLITLNLGHCFESYMLVDYIEILYAHDMQQCIMNMMVGLVVLDIKWWCASVGQKYA